MLGTMAKSLKRSIDYVESLELQQPNGSYGPEAVVDQFHFDASYQYAVKGFILLRNDFYMASMAY
jgi:hypothetical protein